MSGIPSRTDGTGLVPAMAPRVSVVTIFHDAAEFLEEAIRSVLDQTLVEWELVLVDDGSSDAGPDIVDRFGAHDARIRLVRHPDGKRRGTGPSRNLGIREARAPLITFLDADDVYEPERLEAHVSVLDENPSVSVVLSRERYWWAWMDRNGTPAPYPDRVSGLQVEAGEYERGEDLLFLALSVPGAAMPGICSVTYRRDPRLEDPIPPHFTDQYEDQVLVARALAGSRAVVLGACLARYRQHTRSLTSRALYTGEYVPGAPHPARDQFLEWLEEHLHATGHWHDRWRKATDLRTDVASSSSPMRRRVARSGRATLGAALACLPRSLRFPLLDRARRLEDGHVRSRIRRAAASLAAPRDVAGSPRQVEVP